VVEKEQVAIQVQDVTGVWRTYHITMNESQRVLSEMKSLQRTYPNFRVRAVELNSGRVVDIL
jgi:hypothetical protein